MKTFFLFLVIVTCFAACKKSPPIPIVPVPAGSSVYVAGYENKVAKYWKNSVSVIVSDSANRTNALANCIIVVGNDVYIGGYESETASSNIIAKYWKNGKGVNLTVPNPATSPEITFLAVSGTDVYAAGYEQNGNNIEVARYWKNGTPVSLTVSASTSRNARINGINVIDNDVYAAGYEYVLRTDLSGTYAVLVAKYWKNGVDITLNDTQDFTTSHAS